ncbi:MAG TPA: hypothetical protein VMB34_24835 [Acetobacteraceae bacterium]|nr:hypothetical protein [Acetobacteraceae bacterium]
MSRTTIAMLIVLAVVAAILAAPRMQQSAIGELLRGRCNTSPQPTECFPEPRTIPSIGTAHITR